MPEGREEEVGVEVLSAFPSAILYLNADFDGGNFFFTELDAKTVTVSAPSSASLGGETQPQGAGGPPGGQHSPPQTRGPLPSRLFSLALVFGKPGRGAIPSWT